MRLFKITLLICCAFLPFSKGFAQQDIPRLTTQVVDTTGTLSSGFTAQITEQLRAFEARKGSQVAVLVTQTTQPETIEQFGIRLADSWKLGRKKVDDGAILIIALQDRALRIEVGYGLEGALNDATSKRIIEEYIVPQLRAGQLEAGIQAGVDQITRVIDGEALPPPRASAKSSGEFSMGNSEGILVFLFTVAVAIGQTIRKAVGKLPATLISGLGAGALAALLIGLLPALFVGVVVALFVLGSGNASRFPGGVGGYSRRGGGFGSSGGFGGGGGGFGGGGASGRW